MDTILFTFELPTSLVEAIAKAAEKQNIDPNKMAIAAFEMYLNPACRHLPPLDINLTMEQQFELRLMESAIAHASAENLRELILAIAKNSYAKDNALKGFLKQ